MTRVLLVWEDDYFEPLGRLAKRIVRELAKESDSDRPVVLSHTARSNGAFARYINTTWPNASVRGLPADAQPIDHVICIVDADGIADLLKAQKAPSVVDDIAPWHLEMENKWESHLRTHCDPSGPSTTTVHGVVLRWSKESVLLAGYDQAAFAINLEIGKDPRDLAQALTKCNPSPSAVPLALFTSSFRNPGGCLKLLRNAKNLTALKKGAPEIDDALKQLASDSLPVLTTRVPDLNRIASLVWDLHRGTASTDKPGPIATRTPSPSSRPSSKKAPKKAKSR